MKFAVFTFLFSASLAPSAYAGESKLWRDVRALVNRCAIQPVTVEANGHQVAQSLETTCSDIQLFDQGAEFIISGKKYFAYIRDSRFADSGDLNDVEIQDATGTLVGRRSNVPAFGDILLALAGGDSEITVPQIIRE